MGDRPDRTLVRGLREDRGRPRGRHPARGATIGVEITRRRETTVQLAAPAPPRLYRAADGRVAAGVAQGLATHLSVKVLYVRIAFAVLSVFNGFGIVVYLALWA